MYLRKVLNPTELDIVFLQNYHNPEKNSLKEFNEDIELINSLRRYVKNFYVKQNEITFKRMFNTFLVLSNIFPESSYNEIVNYIAYKYFYDESNIFVYYVNAIYYFFDIVIDQSKINEEYVSILKRFV